MADKKILAITACPVGIAHTYIAQEKLEITAQKLGYDIKVETHGSIGIKNKITDSDIKNADLVIIAVAAGASDLGLERFNGKPLYQVEITKVVKDPDNVIKEAFEKVKPFGSSAKKSSSTNSDDIFSGNNKGFMKHIMGGVGYMVPFVVFGGIMIAISTGISQIIYGSGESAPYPNFLWFMNQAGVVSFVFIYGIGAPIGWVMEKFQLGIKKMPIEAMAGIGLLLGAMVGFDMGGPVNKVAFLASVGLIDTSPEFMGAIAAGIPVAPIGMGLTTLIFGKHFNENEKALGLTSLLLGFFGISEGAISFAIRDPKRAIISNVIGSAVAGCIAGAFFITDLAAHGGPIVGILGAIASSRYDTWVGILIFFLAIIIGSFVTCLIYGGLLTIQSKGIKIFKKPKKNDKTNQSLEEVNPKKTKTPKKIKETKTNKNEINKIMYLYQNLKNQLLLKKITI